MEKIIFQNIKYPIREITLPELGDVIISTITLNNVLMVDDGGYVSNEASNIDEKIYYFVDESEIILSDSALLNLVLIQIL